MAYECYKCFKIRIDRGVAFATIDHPPMNVLDVELLLEIDRIGQEVEADPKVKVVAFNSADPDYFVARGDIVAILGLPDQVPPKSNTIGFVHAIMDRFRTMPKVSIAKLEGRARGGGSEFALALDMRFAAAGRAIVSQPEVAMGIIPGAGGTQQLPRLVGRARALEMILGCDDFPAELAERYGYVNRTLPPRELGPFVERLAYRIASFPDKAIRLAKAAVNAAELPIVEGFIEEAHFSNQAMVSATARRLMRKFLEIGGQSRQAELDFKGLIDRLAE
jgi:enoyl-CoA hydratase/carnithine racemase